MLLTAALGLAATSGRAQTIIFTETFGTTDTTGTALESATGLDNNGGGITFESIGGADVRSSSESSGYPGASGSRNVYLTDNTEGFYIFGIDYTGYNEVSVSFGAFEGVGSFTGFNDDIFEVEYSLDATNSSNGTWNTMAIIASSYTGNGWQDQLVSTSSVSTGTDSTISFRFTSEVGLNGSGSSTNDLRIDDITITAIPEPSSIALMVLAGIALYVVRRRRN